MAACTKNDESPSNSETSSATGTQSTSPTTAAGTTTTSPTTAATETTTTPTTTPGIATTTTKLQSLSPAPAPQLNAELLTEFGSTFAEIRNKYGKIKQTGDLDGGIWFQFENSPNTYYWKSTSSGTPQDTDVCVRIDAPIAQLFKGLDYPVSVADIEKTPQLKHTENFMDSVLKRHVAAFAYENMKIWAYASNESSNNNLIFDAKSIVSIRKS